MNKEVSAEMLLGHLYPELELLWTVRHRGTFYRNYTADVMNLDDEELTIDIARDGLLKLLPPAILTGDFELTKTNADGVRQKKDVKTRYEEMKRRLHILEEAFLPIDTFNFRNNLATERHIEEILELKVNYVLKEYFNFDIEQVKDPLVAKAALLLPLVANRRGDIRFVKRIIENIAGRKVRIRKSAYSDTDNSQYWMQKIDFDIVVDNLTEETYREEEKRIAPLTEFISAYLVPIDIFCSFNIVGKNTDVKLLNYNTNVL